MLIKVMITTWTLFLLSFVALANSEPTQLLQAKSVFQKMEKLKSESKINTLYLKYLALNHFAESNPHYSEQAIFLKSLMESIEVGDTNLFDYITSDPIQLKRHQREILLSYGGRNDQTWENAFTSRSAYRVVKEAPMNSCVDYVKAFFIFMENWKHKDLIDEWKVAYLYSQPEYINNTCPQMGRPAQGDRPFIHTIVLARIGDLWVAVNPEVFPGQTGFELKIIGSQLPKRHTEFHLNALYDAQPERTPFMWSAVASPEEFQEGFDGNILVNLAISGNRASSICK